MSTRSDILVRTADLDDLDDLVLMFEHYRTFYGRPTDRGQAREYLRDRLCRAESTVLLAVEQTPAGRSALGFAQVYPTFSSLAMGRVLALNDLFVEPEARDRGAGRRLVECVQQLAREQGAVRVTLETAATNLVARRLYESSGFVRDDHFVRYSYTPDAAHRRGAPPAPGTR